MITFSKLLLVLTCAMAMTACGGSSSSPAPQPSNPTNGSTGDLLGGTPDQPFAQRVAQMPYPTSSLLTKPEVTIRILGPDADHNGIRDDVDALIATLATDPVELKAYQQYAKIRQSRFLVADKQGAYENSGLGVKALKCVTTTALKKAADLSKDAQTAAFDTAIANVGKIGKQTRNTLERVIRADEVDGLTHGFTASFGPDDLGKEWCN
jgi:hypothetical protein